MPERPTSPAFLFTTLLAISVTVLAGSCRKIEKEVERENRYFKTEPVRVEAVHQNGLRNEPTAFLRSRADDPLAWQPWSKELFEHAEFEQKPIFGLLAGGHYPSAIALLERLKRDAEMIRILQKNYVCTLIDISAHPEMALLMYHLSSEIKRPIAFPSLVWFSHEGNPIAWLPLGAQQLDSFETVFTNSHEMVRRIWRDNPRYVVTNSRNDSVLRVERISSAHSEEVDEEIDTAKFQTAIQTAGRKLSALYDPTSGAIDGSGGLLPFPLLELSASLGMHPGTSPVLKGRLRSLVEGHSALLLRSAVHDPLDGGFFYALRSRGWSLPVFVKDSSTQVEAVISLARTRIFAQKEDYLGPARRLLDFIDERLAEGGDGIGLYEFAATPAIESKAYLWSLEELRVLLAEDEMAVVKVCYGVKGLGNIPTEDDPKRDHFRLNSLRLQKGSAEAAAELGLAPERAAELLESARQRLLVHRRELLDSAKGAVETARIAATNARFVMALVELSRSAGDETLLARAGELLASLRQRHYSAEGGLMRIPAIENRRGIDARGIDYAMVLGALLDLYRHDLDPALLIWAEQLAREALEQLGDAELLLQEEPARGRINTLALYNSSMVLGFSTWGTIYGPLTRLHQITGSEALGKALEAIRSRTVPLLVKRPLVRTDFMEHALIEVSDTVIYLDGPREDPALVSLHQVLLEPANDSVTVVHLHADLPAAFKQLPKPGDRVRALMLRGDEEAREAANPAELRALLDGGSIAE